MLGAVVKIICLCRIKEAKYSCAAIGRQQSTVSSMDSMDRCNEKSHCSITVGPELTPDPQCNGEQSEKSVLITTDMVCDFVLSICWFVGSSRTYWCKWRGGNFCDFRLKGRPWWSKGIPWWPKGISLLFQSKENFKVGGWRWSPIDAHLP